MTIATRDPHVCPDCGDDITEYEVRQPPLIRHGGYGATRSDRVAVCRSCGWHLWRERSEVRP